MGVIDKWYLIRFEITNRNGSLDSKVHGANIGPIWGRQDPGGPHVGPMNFAIRVTTVPVDVQAPNGARVSSATVMTEELDI